MRERLDHARKYHQQLLLARRVEECGGKLSTGFLGVKDGFGKDFGVADDFVASMIKSVGNYGEIYDRNVGLQSPLRFQRGVNALWNNGGVMYPLSFQ